MARVLALSLLTTTLVIVGCPAGNDGEDCTAMAAVSVSVTVIDPEGADVPDAVVTYTREDSDQAETCESGPDVYLCGYEVSGNLTIRAEAAGFQGAETEVLVTEDECHVNGESVELVLQPVDCPAMEIPSVLVSIVDTDGQFIPGAWAEYAPECEDWFAPQVCDEYGADAWICGWDFVCPLYIDAYAPGYTPDSAIVDPDEDECGPITAGHEFVLELQ